MSLSPDDHARLDALKEKADARREAAFALRKSAGDEILARSRARHRAELIARVDDYFRAKYGDEWREVKERLSHAG